MSKWSSLKKSTKTSIIAVIGIALAIITFTLILRVTLGNAGSKKSVSNYIDEIIAASKDDDFQGFKLDVDGRGKVDIDMDFMDFYADESGKVKIESDFFNLDVENDDVSLGFDLKALINDLEKLDSSDLSEALNRLSEVDGIQINNTSNWNDGFNWTNSNFIKPSSKRIKKELTFTDFNKLDISSVWKVNVSAGSEYKITIEYPENYKDLIEVNKNSNSFHLDLVNGMSSSSNLNLTAEIVMPKLNEIELSGASELNIKGFSGDVLEVECSGATEFAVDRLTYNLLDIDSSGASEIELNKLSIKNIDLDISGASEMFAEGDNISNLYIDCSGAAEIDFKQLSAKNIELHLSGATEASLLVNGGSISGTLSGVSSVEVYGDYSNKDLDVSFTSNINFN